MFKKITLLLCLLLTIASVGPSLAADTSLSDLTISRLYVPIRNQYAGSPFNAQDVQVTIKNLNSQIANEARIDFLIIDANGATVCQGKGIDIGTFGAWETLSYTLDRYQFINCPDLEADEHTLRAVVDYENKVAESNEDNNFSEQATTVKEITNASTISNLNATIYSLTNKVTRIGYALDNFSDSSRVEYATESFWGEQKKYDLYKNPIGSDKINYSIVASTTDRVAYRYRVILGDSNLQTPGQIVVLLPADINPGLDMLKIQNLIEIKSLTDTSATISWETNKESSSKVSYEIDNYLVNGDNIGIVENTDDSVRIHSVNLTNLTPDTHYYYKVESSLGEDTITFISSFYTNEKMYQTELVVEEPVTEPVVDVVDTTEPVDTVSNCASASLAVPGDLVKMEGNNSVYYYGNDCKRYVFPNEKTYLTWYGGYASVKVISADDLYAISLSDNVTYRPGIKMVKITTNPKVYAVAKNGTLRWVKTEAVATALYGVDWNTKIDDVADAFFTNYTIGEDIDSADNYNVADAKSDSVNINVDKGL